MMCVRSYVSVTLRNVEVTSHWNVAVSRLQLACGLRNSECHVCVRMALAVGALARSSSLEDLAKDGAR